MFPEAMLLLARLCKSVTAPGQSVACESHGRNKRAKIEGRCCTLKQCYWTGSPLEYRIQLQHNSNAAQLHPSCRMLCALSLQSP